MLNRSHPSDHDHSYDYENIYYPLSASYIPEIHPSNLSLVTPSPDSYLHLLASQNNPEYRGELSKNASSMNKSRSNNLHDEPTLNANPTKEVFYDDTMMDCPFINGEDHVTGFKAGAYWLYTGTILSLLACNIVFLVWIMKVYKLSSKFFNQDHLIYFIS